MRPYMIAATCLALLVTGCSRSAARAIEAANLGALRSGDQIVTLFAAWDSEPKEWLLISDYRAAGDSLLSGSRWLVFNDGALDDTSRETIAADEELVTSRTLGSLRQHQQNYQQARGKLWTWEIFSTNANPRVLIWKDLGAREIAGEPLHLYRTQVSDGCTRQKDCVFANATAIVGLTSSHGLRFEYLENTGEVTMARWLLYWHQSADQPFAVEKTIHLAPKDREMLYTQQRDHMRQALDEIRPLSA